ncbi:MAG TPA: DUF3489 domain-containing protein [Bradyrhizobium sp.]|nr:DUF3489 domain-containing protein [Bradyrhizobium sp.]
MTKLTDTQLIVLSSASKHDEGLATRPSNLHAAAAQKVASSLIGKGLAREIRAKADALVWDENDDGRFALKITKAGREAIGVEDEVEDAASSHGIPAASKSKKGATKAAAAKSTTKAPAARTQATAQRRAGGGDEASSGQLRAGSKQAAIVDLMVRPKGATLDELIAATDWLPHTTRAALTGLRHRGYAIERTRGEDKITRYRATPPEGSASQSKDKPAATPDKPRLAKAA